jgi:hypothetical protein
VALPHIAPVPDPDAAGNFSPIDNEPWLRWQRAVHLAPKSGLGVARRAVFFALLGWVPLALWALSWGRVVDVAMGESLVHHYGVHVRCLLVIPLMILGESTVHRAALLEMPQFVRSGLVDDTVRPQFGAVLRAVRRWRDSSLPWVLVVGAAVAWTVFDRPHAYADAMSWALDERGRLAFGGVWFAYVVRPIFLALLLGWLWRLVLLAVLVARLARLRLALVPSHPDGAGGLGFLEKLPGAFAPVTFALSATLASRWAHEIVSHGQRVDAFLIPTATFVVAWSLLLLAPFVPLMPVLFAAKREALPSYAAMVAEQSRLVRQRWIDGTSRGDSPRLEPAGVGPIADAATMYDAVRSMRILPIGKTSITGILVPVVAPMLVVAALQIPVSELLLGLIRALI